MAKAVERLFSLIALIVQLIF